MKENIKLVASIITKTSFKWGSVVFLGGITTIITFFTALFTNLNCGSEQTEGLFASIINFAGALFSCNFFAFILVFGMPIFIILYVVIANKLSIQNAIYLLWEGKAGNYVTDKFNDLMLKITEKEGWRKNISDKVVLKAKLLQTAKEDKDTSRLHKKIISFGLSKVSLDDVDFSDENVNLASILTDKFENFMSDLAKPSMKIFWGLVLLQIILLIVSFFS